MATSVFGGPTVITEVKTGHLVSVLRGHNGHVRALTFDASGQRIATTGTDGSVSVWDLKQHSEYPLQRYITRYQVAAMAANPTKPEIALANGNNQRRPQPLGPKDAHCVEVFNADTRAQREIKTRHSNWLTSVVYSPDGKYLLTGSLDHSVNCIRRKSVSVHSVFERHEAPIVSVACLDNARAISADLNGTVKIWQIETGTLDHSWDTQQSSIVSLQVDSQNDIAFVVSKRRLL